jgi:hypothetical protein
MEIRIVFKGRIPCKKNSQIKTKTAIIPNAEYREWETKWKDLLIEQFGGRAYYLEECRVEYDFIFGSNIITDISGKMESINDLLQDVGILNQDSWRDLRGGRFDCSFQKGIWECHVLIIGK